MKEELTEEDFPREFNYFYGDVASIFRNTKNRDTRVEKMWEWYKRLKEIKGG